MIIIHIINKYNWCQNKWFWSLTSHNSGLIWFHNSTIRLLYLFLSIIPAFTYRVVVFSLVAAARLPFSSHEGGDFHLFRLILFLLSSWLIPYKPPHIAYIPEEKQKKSNTSTRYNTYAKYGNTASQMITYSVSNHPHQI